MRELWTQWMIMRHPCLRAGMVVAAFSVLVALVSGPTTLGGWGPRDPHQDSFKCPQPACTDVCDPSQYVIGTCSEGQGGKGTAMTYACCCCGEGTNNHWFHGG